MSDTPETPEDDERDRVRDTTLAEIIRDNTGIGNEIQDNVFVAP